ncbi:MAG: hypothetical protein KDD90_01770 [Sphingomonadaceae bacterium]|jgi:hypothetical protein|nr:hypothetical protein [Sphingomonadaceae bacterium]
MSKKSLHLGKLLKFFGAQDNHLVTDLRSDLRRERDKLEGGNAGGMDFYNCFWADAKWHVNGVASLKELTRGRVAVSAQRRNLYPKLCSGFLDWFDEVNRATNRHVGLSTEKFHNHLEFEALGLELKVDNLLTLKFGTDNHRLVYPYFAKKTALSKKWARVGLWCMLEAFPEETITDLEILDVLRGTGFSGAKISLRGDEEFLFEQRYREIEKTWNELRPHYGLK